MAEQFRISCLDDDSVKVFNSFWAEHGLCFLVETEEQTVLFDVGTTGTVVGHNAQLLKKDLSEVTHIVLSHAHYDHTGSLDWALDQTRNPVLIADTDLFVERVSRREGATKQTGVPVSRERVEARAQLVLTEDMFQIGEGMYLTGRIPRENQYEVANPKMLIRQGDDFSADSFLDDRSLILEAGEGIVVLLGCCHAGLVNTMNYVRKHFSAPIKAIIGGTHLLEASPEQMTWTIQELKNKFQPERMYFNHCTGFNALVTFRNAFGERLQTMPAGEVLEF
ncbi:MAG: MBL fold metallo-hydrolase [Anaerolineaceae bacterium]|nr:MBL fold metallo-hydrolase [Anaerolineaceae bacterium]